MERHLAKKARRASGKNHLKGSRKRTAEDDERFSESLERLIRKALGYMESGIFATAKNNFSFTGRCRYVWEKEGLTQEL